MLMQQEWKNVLVVLQVTIVVKMRRFILKFVLQDTGVATRQPLHTQTLVLLEHTTRKPKEHLLQIAFLVPEGISVKALLGRT